MRVPNNDRPASGLDSATVRAAQLALAGKRPGIRGMLPFVGPAFIASIAYVDPGNFATNIQGGARFGYLLLWVVLASNVDRDVHPGALGQARHRHPAEPGRGVPRAVPAPGGVDPVGPLRAHRDGDRSGGGAGCGGRAPVAVRHAAGGRGPADGRAHVRHPRTPALRLPPAGGGADVAGGGDRRVLRRRDGLGRARLGRGRPPRPGPPSSRDPKACSWPSASWARRSCRTSCSSTRT